MIRLTTLLGFAAFAGCREDQPEDALSREVYLESGQVEQITIDTVNDLWVEIRILDELSLDYLNENCPRPTPEATYSFCYELSNIYDENVVAQSLQSSLPGGILFNNFGDGIVIQLENKANLGLNYRFEFREEE
ncbi:MAG: hypothetical protein AAFY14_04280 [Pseudomonadota bacterium]